VGQVGRPKFKGANRPADRVTWYDAVELANLLSTATGLTPAYAIDKTTPDPATTTEAKLDDKRWTVTRVADATGFRLPTEAQWEYACRAGTTTIFSCGDAIDSTKANFNGRSAYNRAPESPWAEQTLPVGSFPPNPWGFLDIHGNVWEWCWDRYGEYPVAEATDPEGAASGPDRVMRGGTWEYKGAYLRSAARIHYSAAKYWDLIGVRLAVPPTR
jgi:formylglycine-generating enzyme required for sulfatase activity